MEQGSTELASSPQGEANSLLFDQAVAGARATFGYETLRPHQAEVLQHVFAGRDALAVLPTGSGKSLCYALPALVRPGLVLVVSPLIALIRDQVRKFAASGLACAAFDSLQTPDEKARAAARLDNGELQLLLVSPERLARTAFRARLKAANIQLVAIDEAHCISHWGSHFRPDYRLLGGYLADLGPVQKLAVTATATTRVRDDIVRTLQLAAPVTVWGDLARENLHIKIIKTGKVSEQLTALLQAVLSAPGSGIVYVPTRKSAREVHRMLCDGGVRAGVYHAGLAPGERQAAQQAFMDGRTRVMVATHAFGLGIDKQDIRFVHHAGLPGSLEQYVQEIGRAGRDGLAARCSLICGNRDHHIQRFMIDKSFPSVALLSQALEVARAYVAGGIGKSPQALQRRLEEQLDGDPRELASALEVLCREGLLTRLRAQGYAPGETEILIGEGRAGEETAIFAEYPHRKADCLSKLEAMKTFVTLGDERTRFLDDYFRK